MALKFWQKEHLAPLSPDRGEGSGVRGETRLPRAARTVQKDAGFTVARKSKCKSAMHHATPNRNKFPQTSPQRKVQKCHAPRHPQSQ